MAVQPGEENVATLFADVHYFYGPPTDDPPHHRFDKGSYIYLFENANQGRARIEVANQPGTDNQDAFDGHLDRAHLQYSYKHSCLVTLTVGAVEGHDEWHLPTYDPHNQNKYHYRLHSVDIYFWTQQDALQFVNGIRRVLPTAQCEVLDEPGPPPRHTAEISEVVQKLERAAISTGQDPTGPNGNAAVPSFAPPPLSAVSGTEHTPPPQQFAPIAYNPAAPAAPEQVRHREKTPPPLDAEVSPLHQTLAHDAATPFSPGLVPSGRGPLSPAFVPPQFSHPSGAPSFPGPPVASVASPGMPPQGFGTLGGHPTGLAQHPGLARSATMPVQAMHSPYGTAFPGSPGYTHTPTPPITSPGLPPPQPQALPGGYNPAAPAQANEYSIHQQYYVPENGGSVNYKPKVETRGKLEENAGRLERGVSGMLKKFEKKFG
ncbi:hypothetical protein GQ53DRAFT_741285 [Thozetella sp. PMI_491]|nr:hypothetical protein GQ53DRAFT_741285 [Thozetella sp. PMI_491]